MNTSASANDTSRDWALLIGIDGYPNLNGEGEPGNLEGAIGDLDDFANFLSQHFLVNPEQILTVRSPDPENPNMPVSLIQLSLRKLELIKLYDRLRQGPDWRQRRIYIFIAGHGFIPTDEYKRAVILAEAVQHSYSHFIAQDAITYFETTKMFEEVLLFMDCCAVRNFNIQPAPQPWPASAPQQGGLAPTRVMRVYAASSDQPTRELEVRQNSKNKRGLFTQFLLKVLRGDHNGRVNTKHIKQAFDNAHSNFANLLNDVFELDNSITFLPWCPSDPGFDIFDFDIDNPVRIPLDFADSISLSEGDEVEAWQNGTANGTLVDQATVTDGKIELDLADGLFTLRINSDIELNVQVSNRTITSF